MTKKQLLINAAIIIFVPTVITAGYYGYKAYKHYKNKKKGENEDDEISNKEKEASIEIDKEAKVIPLNSFKPAIQKIENNTEKTEKQV
ncbi:MAG: hypothetical protein PHT69_01980 [Bacteroidales bacterium]|nr:hypothetical protein [Bacteroidales bacterium]